MQLAIIFITLLLISWLRLGFMNGASHVGGHQHESCLALCLVTSDKVLCQSRPMIRSRLWCLLLHWMTHRSEDSHLNHCPGQRASIDRTLWERIPKREKSIPVE